MPTAGRLFAAIAFAVLGAYLALIVSPLFQEGKQPSYWWPLCVATGVWSGCVVVGKRAGRGWSAAIGNGLTGVFALLFWVLFIISSADMIAKSLRRLYDGPVEAVVNVFQIIMDYVLEFGSVELAIQLLIGGAIGGLFAEFFARRLP